MRKLFYLVCIAVVALFTLFVSGQFSSAQNESETANDRVNTETARGLFRGASSAVHFDISPPLRTMKATKTREERERDEFEDRPTGLEGPLGPQEVDQSVQSVISPFAPLAMPTPIVSFDSTISCGGCAPPDPVGDVGPNHYVAMGNAQFQIFNKSGTSLFGPANINTLWAGFGGTCQTANSGDPIVIYDQLDDRWILTQFTATTAPFYNCVAVSTSSDPTGSYYRYAFTTGSNFPDYPKYGMWGDALYISTREFLGVGGAFQGVGAYAVNRAQLIAGNPAAQVISFLAAPGGTSYNVGDGLLPSDLDGSTLPPANSPNYFIGSMDNGGPYSAPQDALTIWKFTANFAVPASSSFTLANTVPIASYDTIPAFCSGRACIDQPSTTNKIDHLGYRQRALHRAAYRNFGTHESIVTNQSVEASATMSGIRWWEIRSPNSSPTIFQEGTYAPGTTDGIHRWMGSIAMDANGNMAMGYSAASASVFPSVRYTGRLVGDTPGTMPQGEASIVAGTGSQTAGGNRWGDYSSMNIDSTDDCTFWYVSEYVPTTSAAGWRLRIGSFKFPSCSLGPNFTLAVTPASQEICAPANAVYTVNTTSISGFTNPVTLSATGNPAGTTVTFVPNPVTPGSSSTMTVSNTGAGAPGLSTINVLGTSGALTQNQDVTLNLYTASPGTATLTAPANGATATAITPTFTWSAATQAKTYTLEVATDAGFTNIVHTGTGITTTTYSGATLSAGTPYFWRVRAVNPCGPGTNSPAFSFTTALICIVPFTNAAAITINDNAAGAPYPSNVTVSGLTGSITKVTVDLTGMAHTFPDDIDILLVGPGGQKLLLMSDAGGSLDVTGVNLTFDDAAATAIPDTTQIASGTFKPANYDTTTDVFPASAPAGPYPDPQLLSVFNGTNPNGTWSLYVRDDAGTDIGQIAGGWTLRLTTSCTAGTPSPTATNTFTPTATSTNTATPTATATSTFTPTATFTNTATATATATNTFTPTATSTNTFTPTPTATNTFTPTATATETFTPTATATATFTPTATATETFTPTPQAVISGTVTYGNAIGSPAPPRFVSGVSINAAGSPGLSDTTSSLGTYSLTGFGSGSYTITPSRSGGDNASISSFDAARISQYVTSNISFTSAQLAVADVSGTSGISSFDAALIARYVASLGSPTGSTGTWIFNPANYTHPSITSSLTENYSALLMGETSGNWTDLGPRPAEAARGAGQSVEITAPSLAESADKDIVIPVAVRKAANKGIISYEFDVRYDPSVIRPQIDPVGLAGTVSRGLFAVSNSSEAGLLRVVMYGPLAIDSDGILLNLRFTVVGASGSVSPLTWERIVFNEGEIPTITTNGQIAISYADSSSD